MSSRTSTPDAQDATAIVPVPAATGTGRDRRAGMLVALTACGLGGLYLWRGAVAPVPLDPRGQIEATAWLGLDRWAFVDQPWRWLFLELAVVAGASVARWTDACRRMACTMRRALERPAARLALAAASTVLFWCASTNRVNLDGLLLQQKFTDAAARTGAFVTHDEMLELYLHSRLWIILHAAWGWDVAQTYRATSCLAGGVAVFLVLGLSRRFLPSRWPLVVAGLFAGGWVLVFFGDVENYTLTNVAVLTYLTMALRYLDDEHARLWPAGFLLGIAALCHLEALVLSPSLLVLGGFAIRRRRPADAAVAVLAVPALLGAAVWWFNLHELPITDLATHSQISAQGGHFARFIAPAHSQYIWLQLQLLLLLVPSLALLPALLSAGILQKTPRMIFLAVASAGALLMVGLWRAQLGAYNDWNLYAMTAQPLGLFVFGGLATQPSIRRQAAWLAALVVLMITQTAAWIAEHHAILPT